MRWFRPAGMRRTGLLLPGVIVCLVGSAGFRLASGAGAAIAEGVSGMSPHGEGATEPSPDDAGCTPAPDIAAVLERLTERETLVTEAEKRMAERSETLKVAEARIAQRLGELKSAEEKLAATVSRASTASEDDLTRLTTVYESMKPKEAVPLFEAMMPDFAAGFLGRMRPESAASILAGMQPEKAYAISAILAGRNALVPTPPATR